MSTPLQRVSFSMTLVAITAIIAAFISHNIYVFFGGLLGGLLGNALAETYRYFKSRKQ